MIRKRFQSICLALGFVTVLLPDKTGFAETQVSYGWPPITAQTRPWTRWWWMGSAVDAANLDRELQRYHNAGLGGVEVTPIYGVKGWEDREIPYLSPKWMEMLDHAISTGARLGMETDMTMGTGWCFGGPTVSNTDANAALVAAQQTVQTGAKLSGTFDPDGTQALMAFTKEGKNLDLTAKIGRDGRVDWTAEGGPWTVYAISQSPSGVMVKRAAPGGQGPMLNLFYPDAVARYMEWFDKPFSEAKPKLRALFQDSYEYNSDWAPDFFANFEKLRGYRLQTELPALLGDAADDHTARVKSDYRETISDIMTFQSIPVWSNWAHAHKYLIRYQAHGAPGNLLDLYADADIPETEMFSQGRNVLTSKFASSAAHVMGRKLASAETGTWMTEHFQGTLGDMKGLVDKMFLSGINHVVYHGTAYTPDEAAWPGWLFYASTEMNPRNPIWHDVPALNDYIARCQSVLQSGWPANDVLVYWPVYDGWNNAQGMVQQFGVDGRGWFDGAPVADTARHLWERGFGFDYVSDHQLETLKEENGHLIAGGARYRAVVVPPCKLMPAETLRRLIALSKAGVAVIFQGALPEDVPGFGDLEERRKIFRELLVEAKGTVFIGDVEAGLNTSGVEREAMADRPGLQFVRRSVEGGSYYFITNQGAVKLNGWTSLAIPARSMEWMDPMTGRIGMAKTVTNTGRTAVYLQLEPGASIILRTFTMAEVSGPAWPVYYAEDEPVELRGTWNVKFINGGPRLPAPFASQKLASWTLLGDADAERFAGTAVYTITFDAPDGWSGQWALDLGKVCQSARVRLNGKPLGTLITAPFTVQLGTLLPKGNVLEVEVTNVAANRIRDMDIRHIPWKIFDPPNIVSLQYKTLDASKWPLMDSGLLGPVMLTPEKTGK